MECWGVDYSFSFSTLKMSHFFLLPWFLMRNAQPLNTCSSYMQCVAFLWLLSNFLSLIFSSLVMICMGVTFFDLSCWGLLSFLIL